MEFQRASRIRNLPPYLFKEIDRLRNEARAKGKDVIDLGVGDPDRPTPPHVVQAAQQGVAAPANHQYPSYAGLLDFRQAVADWYQRRFGVGLDPAGEVMALIGSKEGIAHFPMAFVDPGDVVLYTSPGYPVYRNATLFAGGEPFELPLRPDNGFFPDLEAVPAGVLKRAKLLFINYPNNPTSATATVEQFKTVVAYAAKHGLIICHDAAYTEMTFDGYVAPSVLETPGAKEMTIEFHSLSKTFQMTGWRVGMAVGNAELIKGLLEIKSNVDSGVFQAVQRAGIAAMQTPQAQVEANMREYSVRRRVLADGLKRIGLEPWPSQATFYVWVKTPKGVSSATWTARLLEEAAVVVTPGNGFGAAGEGYFRIALSLPPARLEEAVARMAKLGA